MIAALREAHEAHLARQARMGAPPRWPVVVIPPAAPAPPPMVVARPPKARVQRPQPPKAGRHYGPRWLDHDVAALTSLAAAGKTAVEIGRQLDRSAVAVKCKARLVGVAIVDGGHPPVSAVPPARFIKNATVDDLAQIAQATAQRHSIEYLDLLGLSIDVPISRARQEAVWLCARDTDLTYSALARFFDRDHSTAIYAVRIENERRGANVRDLGGVPRNQRQNAVERSRAHRDRKGATT